MNSFKIELRHATRKFSSALFRVLLGFIEPLYGCINCIGKILLKIVFLLPVRFRIVCFRPPRSAFSRSAVCGLCFRDTLQVHRPVSQRFAFPRVICSPEHWALVLCVPPSPPFSLTQCYVFPSLRDKISREI